MTFPPEAEIIGYMVEWLGLLTTDTISVKTESQGVVILVTLEHKPTDRAFITEMILKLRVKIAPLEYPFPVVVMEENKTTIKVYTWRIMGKYGERN